MNTDRLFILLSVICLLSGNLSAQVFPGKTGFDRFGGYPSYKGVATGRFHLETFDGRHLLVTPQGHGYISIGVTHTGGLARPEQSRYDYFDRRFRGDWNQANAEILSNFRQWGYNSLGYDSHPSTRELLPHFASCSPTGNVSSWMGKQVEFPDVFSKTWKDDARQAIETMVKRFGQDPNLIGIYWTDMPAWDLAMAKRTVGLTWVDAIRALPKEAPGRIRYESFLRENGADSSDEDFLVLIAREVYSFIGPLTRKLAPGTLVFGERYAGRPLPRRVIQEALPWIDVVSVQPAASEFPAKTFEQLYQETRKPVMICDHQSSFRTSEHANVMWQTMPDIASVAKGHASYLDEGFATPYLIGYHRCQYIDRYKDGQKILKQGLLQVDGKPYEDLVNTVQENNWRLHKRFQATSGASTAHAKVARWESTIKAFEARDATGRPLEGAVLLIGGSNARRWTDVDQYFPHHHVINRAFGGARLIDVMHFADRIVLPYKPKTIILNAGGNDLSSGQSPEQIRDTARDFIAKVHGALPDTQIYFLGLPLVRRSFTTPKVRTVIEKTNVLLAELAATEEHVDFIDLAQPLLSDRGEFRPELYVSDGTHFSVKGYAVISRRLREKFGD